MEWLILISYVAIGAYLTPRFAKDSYLKQKAMWSHNSEQENLTTGAMLGWVKSWVWPIWLLASIVVNRITADHRAETAAEEQAKTVAGAKAVIAKYEEEERRKWAAEFRNGGTK